MSRRKPQLEPLPNERYSRNFTVKIVCDHGGDGKEPPRTVLYHLADWRGITHRDADLLAVTAGRDGGPLRGAPAQCWTADGGGRRTWTFHCGRCADNVPLQEENLLRIIDLLRAEAGLAAGDGHLVVPVGLARKMAALLH